MEPCVTTLAELEAEFLGWMHRELQANRCSEATIRYYRTQLAPWVAAVGPGRQLTSIVAFDLERHKTTWHRVQTVQRLFNWAVDAELLPRSPFRKIPLPPRGQRERVLSRVELVLLLRQARREFRLLLVAMVHSLARPQEIRVIRWSQLLPDSSAFVLSVFKGKRRRRDGVRTRTICIDARLRRLLERLRRRRTSEADDFVFVNSRGKPWTTNAVRLAMKRLRRRCGLDAGDGTERIVCYTLRHTAATTATANGVRDRVLAELMGHASTRTTARYQHLQPSHLTAAIEQATRKRAA
jgi:integrase